MQRLSSSSKLTDRRFMEIVPVRKKRFGWGSARLAKAMALLFISCPTLLILVLIFQHQASDRRIVGFAEARMLNRNVTLLKLDSEAIVSKPNDVARDSNTESFKTMDASHTSEADASETTDVPKEELYGGLLASGFEEASCLSRYQSILYRKPSPYKPSSFLISKLRNYENRHKLCGPFTRSYNTSLTRLESRSSTAAPPTDCRYVVWISFSGLGNKVLTLASTFLYALLTDRVLLVDRGKDMDKLFCEPFPEKSWFLPLNFPLINHFESFGQKSAYCYGNMLKKNIINSSSDLVPSYSYLHLVHDYDDQDKLFFCDEDQAFLDKVPWLIVKSDTYFVPFLFLMPCFEEELSKMFPSKETVFHHLGRYLFHPSNHVWGLITRFYQAYLSKADEKIGIQIRSFDAAGAGPFKHVMDQILACTQGEKLLPKVNSKRTVISLNKNLKTKAVLMTSLLFGYYENIRKMYWEHPTVTGEAIGFYQPSHEEYQQSEKQMHNMKAWAEMYLLSLTDVLVTSAWSTFGYVAQGLGGLRPWILYRPENRTTPNPPCGRAASMEPCFHAPPFYDCKAKRGADTGKIVPHVRHCEDVSWGLKIVDEL